MLTYDRRRTARDADPDEVRARLKDLLDRNQIEQSHYDFLLGQLADPANDDGESAEEQARREHQERLAAKGAEDIALDSASSTNRRRAMVRTAFSVLGQDAFLFESNDERIVATMRRLGLDPRMPESARPYAIQGALRARNSMGTDDIHTVASVRPVSVGAGDADFRRRFPAVANVRTV